MSKSFHWTVNEFADNDIFYLKLVDYLIKRLSVLGPTISKHGNSYCYYYKLLYGMFVTRSNDDIMLYNPIKNNRTYNYDAVVEMFKMLNYDY
jgi:hypothetical protein